jgi:hypothetical protein
LRQYVTSWKVAGSIRVEVIRFFSLPNPSSCATALGTTQPLTEMSTRILPGDKGWLVRKADNLTAICELTVLKIWEPHKPMGHVSFLMHVITFTVFIVYFTVLSVVKVVYC